MAGHTFDYFRAEAFQRALDVLSEGLREGAPLSVLHGPPGSGKTHLLRVLEAAAAAEGKTVRYLHRGSRLAEVSARNADLLLVDEASDLTPEGVRRLQERRAMPDKSTVLASTVADPLALAALGSADQVVALQPFTDVDMRGFAQEVASLPFDVDAISLLLKKAMGSPRRVRSMVLTSELEAKLADAETVIGEHVSMAISQLAFYEGPASDIFAEELAALADAEAEAAPDGVEQRETEEGSAVLVALDPDASTESAGSERSEGAAAANDDWWDDEPKPRRRRWYAVAGSVGMATAAAVVAIMATGSPPFEAPLSLASLMGPQVDVATEDRLAPPDRDVAAVSTPVGRVSRPAGTGIEDSFEPTSAPREFAGTSLPAGRQPRVELASGPLDTETRTEIRPQRGDRAATTAIRIPSVEVAVPVAPPMLRAEDVRPTSRPAVTLAEDAIEIPSLSGELEIDEVPLEETRRARATIRALRY